VINGLIIVFGHNLPTTDARRPTNGSKNAACAYCIFF